MKVIIAAAGTGGHINPGIAIANYIKEQEPDSEICFIGTARGLENDLVPRAGYPLKTINAYGINRKVNIDNIKRLYCTLKSIGEAKKIIKEYKPDIVIGTGGYICVAVGLAASKCHVPLVLHESNAFPGIAVKLLHKKAEVIFTGFQEAKDRLPKAKKVMVTGTPTKIKKKECSLVQKQEIKKRLGFEKDLPFVLAFGGSQGAKSINESLMDIIKEKRNQTYNLLWSAGASGYEQVKQTLEKQGIAVDEMQTTKVVPYIYNMEEIYSAVDLIVCRSGAMTITEIAKVGKPAIFIPFPFATENHQEYNAKVLEKVNAATIILDKDLTGMRLNQEIETFIKNPQRMEKMGKNASKIAKNRVEETIYHEIKNIIETKK